MKQPSGGVRAGHRSQLGLIATDRRYPRGDDPVYRGRQEAGREAAIRGSRIPDRGRGPFPFDLGRLHGRQRLGTGGAPVRGPGHVVRGWYSFGHGILTAR